MKKYLFFFVFTLIGFASFSQSSFSMLNYTLPEGWYARQVGENTELVKKGMENSNCKIVFFKPVKIVTDNESLYIKYRNELVNAGLTITSSSKIQKEYGMDWTSFSGMQNTGTKGNASSVAFYSLADTKQTVFLAVYLTNEAVCMDELDAIVQSINLTELNATKTDTKTRKPASKKVRVLPLKSLKAFVN